MRDIAIVGGGINGCGIARDAAGRGLSVFLCEQGDLGGATSSASTKLFDGSRSYMQHHAFPVVDSARRERDVLLRSAPHIVWPTRFVLPSESKRGSRWLLRLGVLLQEYFGGRNLLPPARMIELAADPAGRVLQA